VKAGIQCLAGITQFRCEKSLDPGVTGHSSVEGRRDDGFLLMVRDDPKDLSADSLHTGCARIMRVPCPGPTSTDAI